VRVCEHNYCGQFFQYFSALHVQLLKTSATLAHAISHVHLNILLQKLGHMNLEFLQFLSSKDANSTDSMFDLLIVYLTPLSGSGTAQST
jgi:hypothetical protein